MIHQKLEETKVLCHSGSTKALALCPGVKGIKSEFDDKIWVVSVALSRDRPPVSVQ